MGELPVFGEDFGPVAGHGRGMDELYRLKREIEEKGGDVGGISFPTADEDEGDEDDKD